MSDLLQELLKRNAISTTGSKEEIIASWEHEVEENRKITTPRQTGGEGALCKLSFSCGSEKPPNSSRRSSLAGLKEIFVRDLIVDKTHRGAYIQGTLCVNPKAMTSAQSILQDSYGDLVYVSIYNMIPN